MDFQCLELWAILICNRKVKLSNGSDLKSNISLHSIISTNSLLSCLIEINKMCVICLMPMKMKKKRKKREGSTWLQQHDFFYLGKVILDTKGIWSTWYHGVKKLLTHGKLIKGHYLQCSETNHFDWYIMLPGSH